MASIKKVKQQFITSCSKLDSNTFNKFSALNHVTINEEVFKSVITHVKVNAVGDITYLTEKISEDEDCKNYKLFFYDDAHIHACITVTVEEYEDAINYTVLDFKI